MDPEIQSLQQNLGVNSENIMECQSRTWNVLFNDKYIRNISTPGEVILKESVTANVMKFICFASHFIWKFYGKDSDKETDILAGPFILTEEIYEFHSFPYSRSAVTFAALKPDYVAKTFQIFKFSP